MDMKKMLAKLSEVQGKEKPVKVHKHVREPNTTPKAGKKVINESTTSLKSVFNKLSEDAQGSKPVALMAPGNKQAGTGVITSQDPDVKKMLQSLDPAKVQVVMPQQTGQQNQSQNQPQTTNQTKTPSTSTQPNQQSGMQKMAEDNLDEKIEGGIELNPEKKGMFKGKNKSELMSQYNKLKASGPHKKGSPAFTKMKELAFAIRAKSGWGKVKEAEIPHTGGVDVSGAALGAGRSQTTLEAESPSNAGVSGTGRGGIGMGRNTKTFESAGAERPYICVHVKKGKCEVKAKTSYEAAKKAAEKWKLKSTSGIDAHLADVTHTATNEGRAKADNKAEKAGKKVTKDLEYDMYHKGKDDQKAEKAGKKVTKDIEYDEKKKMKKKKLKESHEHRLEAAQHFGKAHALAKHGYNCPFDEGSDEHHMYHEGYKAGLDECYGKMMPIHGLVHGVHKDMSDMDESRHVVDDMASFGAHTPELDEIDMDEGNAFTGALAHHRKGEKFKMGGRTYKDTSSLAFESWDAQLSNLLTEYNDINEGLSVSVSDQEGQPKSVTVSATDHAADELMSIIKKAGMGMFSHADHSADGEEEVAVVKSTNSPSIDVVDDHDDMMSLIRKMGGHTRDHDSSDYADEEHDHEEGCNECGMMECACPGRMDEVQTEDQMMYQVAEDDTQPQNPPDNGSANATNATKGNTAQNYAGAMYDKSQGDNPVAEDDMDEDMMEAEQVDEGTPEFNARASRYAKANAAEKDREGRYSEKYPGGREQHAKDTAAFLKRLFPPKNEETEKCSVCHKSNCQCEELDEGWNDHIPDGITPEQYIDSMYDRADRDRKEKKEKELLDKDDESEKLDEWANKAGPGNSVSDTTFEQDIEFMTQVIAGGLNKPKRDQTTLPHTQTKPSFADGSIMQTMQRLAAIK